MTTLKTTFLLATTLIVVACNSPKKTTTSAAAGQPETTISKSFLKKGILLPSEEQLTAIKTKYPDATLVALTSGREIYLGACTDCHRAKSIYKFSETKWPGIIDAMAKKAKLTAEQKDALSKYVFSIKATQPVPAK